MSEEQQKLWQVADELRARRPGSPQLLQVITEAINQGILVKVEDVWELAKSEGRYSDYSPPPDYVSKFIAAYLRGSSHESILDIWAGLGKFLLPIIDEFNPNKAVALQIKSLHFEIVSLLELNTRIDWKLGNPANTLGDLDETFDIILGFPSFNWQGKQTFDFSSNSTTIKIRDTLEKLLILRAALLLKPNGVGFFITSPNFIFKEKRDSAYNQLSRLGLSIEAALSLPAGTFTPMTSISGLLLIIRKGKQGQLLMGELTADENSQHVLLKNLKSHTSSNVPHQGIWVEPYKYDSFNELALRYEIASLARRLPFPATALAYVATAVNMPKRNLQEGFKDLPNAVYLPLLGNSTAVASLEDLTIKPQNYVQIVLDTKKAIAPYVAEFFNTPLGMKIREAHSRGFIPRLTKTSLRDMHLYLPDPDIQSKALSTQTKLNELSLQIEQLERRLWRNPTQAPEIGKAAKRLGQDDTLEDWIETLPFPIASILWIYHAAADPEHKVSHLLNFFEALSQFHTTLMLSAYASDKAFYWQEARNWIDTNPEHTSWYKAATFGNWNTIGARLAKATRRFLSNRKSRDLCLRLFGQPEVIFLEMLSSKKLVAVLEGALNYRNSWKHGGILSESRLRLTLLEASLAKVRQIMMDLYTSVQLLAPETSEYTDDMFDYRTKLLMGIRRPFRKINVESTIPLDKSKLYLLPNNQFRPVELLPFLRLIKSPKTQQNACYFYNRIQNDGIRWISYHFESESEIIHLDDPQLEKSFALFHIENSTLR